MQYRKPLGLYIHVPFCAAKCGYCDFYSLAGHAEQMQAYTKAVCAHLKQYQSLCVNYTVDTVYFGGGTPSFLGGKHLSRLLGEITKQWTLTKDAEITVECNPDSMDKRLLRQLRRAGVNRLSIGVQSAHDDQLQQLQRLHTFAQAQQAIRTAQQVGFDNLSIDLMYGLPGQTTQNFLESLDAVLALSPTHLSCYGLKLEDGTPMARQNLTLPDDDAQVETYLALCSRLQQAGFSHYEISNWARDGKQARHNIKYWDLSEYLGIGPGAHSYLSEQRFSFVRDLTAYCQGVTAGENSIVCLEEDVSTMLRHGEYIMLRLRTRDGLSEATFHQLFQLEFTPYAAVLQPLIARGLVGYDTGRWYLTDTGFLVSNHIISQVLAASLPPHEQKSIDTEHLRRTTLCAL